MPMNVTIAIIGDAIIYKRSKYWNIVLVTDQHHEAVLTDSEGTVGPEPLRKPGIQESQLRLNVPKPMSNARNRETNFNTILNMAHTKLHKGNLKVASNPANGRELIQIRVPIGTVSGNTNSYTAGYWYKTHSGNPNPNEPVGQIPGPIATLAMLTFGVKDSGSAPALSFVDMKGNSVAEWQYNSTRPLTINIDNRCTSGAGGAEDFLHFYDWVSDKRNKPSSAGKPPEKHRFIAGKLIKKPRERKLSPQGNCDPVVIDPPPTGPDPEFP